jgi:hypothetical protein
LTGAWRPFDYVTLTALLPIPGTPKILMSYTFEDGGDGGTHFEFRIANPKPKERPLRSNQASRLRELYGGMSNE